MAEVLGVVVSGLTVAQIAAQLVTCAQQLQTLSRYVRNAPADLQSILDDIEMTAQLLAKVKAFDDAAFPGQGLGSLQNYLLKCQAAASSLQELVTKIIQPSKRDKKFRTKNLIRAVLKKGEIEELKARLDSAKASMQTFLTCHSCMMQIKQQTLLEALRNDMIRSQQSMSFEDSTMAISKRKKFNPAMRDGLLLYQKKCSAKTCCCTCHDISLIQGKGWSLRLPSSFGLWSTCNKASCKNSKSTSIWISLTQVGIPWAVHAGLNYMFSTEHSYISPSLALHRVVRNTSPGFKLLRELETGKRRDWNSTRQDLLDLFDSGDATPRDVDSDGRTWLEKVLQGPWRGEKWNKNSACIQKSLVAMLVQMGSPLNTQRLLYECAGNRWNESRLVLLDDLIKFGFDASEIEAPAFSLWPILPLEPSKSEKNPHAWVENNPDPFFVEWISKNLYVCPGFAGINGLLEAILIESTEQVQQLAARIPLGDQDNLLGQSALHLAVSRPQHLELLLKLGANVDARDKRGFTPLLYATALGNSEVVIRLLQSGADPYLTTPRYQNFLQFALRRSHWVMFEAVLTHLHHFTTATKFAPRDFFNLGLIALTVEYNDCRWAKKSDLFQTLLEWGADPNVIISDDRGRPAGTVLHHIIDIPLVKAIIRQGFTQFDYPAPTGIHALYWSQFLPNPTLMELLLDGGSSVNLQNDKGSTTLHMVSQNLKKDITETCGSNHQSYEERAQIIECIRLLLSRGADSCLGDRCQCACSRRGCTPSNLILKEPPMMASGRKDIWALEFYATVEALGGFETAKQCLLDMLRLVKFEELELTHTCLQESFFFASLNGDTVMESEEVEEIWDEEKLAIQDLEKEMLDIEKLPRDELLQLLLTAILKRKWDRELEVRSLIPYHGAQYPSSQNKVYEVDFWRENFIAPTLPNPPNVAEEADTVGLREYADWVEYEHSKRTIENKPDHEWYNTRVAWIARIQSMNEETKQTGEEEDLQEKRILWFVPDA